ncbi:hypothetical protein MK632_20185 [Rhizobium changzhiense]|uniref:hypothetical protein n=1 Tax=Rhizobium changzhiense TaxID=2692317 RepID=UPI001F0B9D4E|nr:hypothetical protein [Rhizobium changzhiense]MCH4548060.1 hypothetical protein [Rhizobium changzhiense]
MSIAEAADFTLARMAVIEDAVDQADCSSPLTLQLSTCGLPQHEYGDFPASAHYGNHIDLHKPGWFGATLASKPHVELKPTVSHHQYKNLDYQGPKKLERQLRNYAGMNDSQARQSLLFCVILD